MQTHYYQPLWTLVGGGIKTFKETVRSMKDVLPKDCDWIKAKVTNFDPDNNTVVTSDGQKVILRGIIFLKVVSMVMSST